MKNYEKYEEKIRKYEGETFCSDFVQPYILKQDNCCGINCGQCNMIQLMWLMEEYKEPEEPKIDWSKVKVDTPILVRDGENNEWQRSYFAKYEDGFVYTWIAGATSWTAVGYEAGGNVYRWNYAKLAENEE